MKVKLLKKIRKRYKITHYPNGVFLWGEFIEKPITLMQDTESGWRHEISTLEKQEAYNELYEELLIWIQEDYGRFKSKTRKITLEQLWYKNK